MNNHRPGLRSESVSICIPVYNTVRFLVECLDSALAQTRPADEIRILDSHSDDGSWEIIQEYASKHPVIHAEQGPRGLYSSWNHLIQEAKGEWIYILTSDDTMKGNCIERLLALSSSLPSADMLMCAIDLIDDASAVIPRAWRSMPGVALYGTWLKRCHSRRGSDEALRMMWAGPTIISTTGVMVRKTLYQRTGFFPESLGPRGDYIWQILAAQRSTLAYTPEILATWRQHSNQATQSGSGFAYWCYEQAEDLKKAFPDDAHAILAAQKKIQWADGYPTLIKEQSRNRRLRVRILNQLFKYNLYTIPHGFNGYLAKKVRQRVGLADLVLLSPPPSTQK